MNLLVSDPANIHYLTGFASVAPQTREAYALVTPRKTYLFTNSLYTEQAKTLGFPVIEISRDNPLSRQLARIYKGKTLDFEESNLTVSEYNTLKKNFTLVPTRNRVEMLRMIKRPDEIANIRKAAQLTDQCFSHIIKHIKPGATEAGLAWEIESFIRKHGATLAFSPIVAFNKHSSQPHYQGMGSGLGISKGLTPPALVLLDFGARVDGYCGDMTRMVFVGKPKDEWKRVYDTVLQAQRQAFEYLHAQGPALSSQRFGAKADELARSVITRAGFSPYPHSLGHGVGLAIHEAPRLTIKKDELLKPGMVFSIEPAIYLEGRFGIRIEDLVLLTKDGPEILSKSPKDLTK